MSTAALAPTVDVVIAGAGPTGLMLAAELALAGVAVVVIERRATRHLDGVRARGLHARSLEVLDQRGIVDRFLAAGQVAQIAGFAGVPLDISDFPTRHPHGLALFQQHIEGLLAAWVDELGVAIVQGAEVGGFVQDNDGVDVTLVDGRVVRAGWLVGCDGGRSGIRKGAGIAFDGFDATTSNLIAEARFAVEPATWGIHRDARGIHALSKIDDGCVSILVTERDTNGTGDPSLAELSAALDDVYGTDYGVHSPRWLSRFTDMTRQAAAYRAGRVLLAGDACHVHAPDGGQGLNLGIQDAVNLGWKLARVVHKIAPDSLLDTYHAERHPVGARALRHTMASVAMRRDDDRTKALRETIADVLVVDDARIRLAALQTGLDIAYDLGVVGHPLIGRRMPDLDLVTAEGITRVYALLRAARPVLLRFDSAVVVDVGGWADRVVVVAAVCAGPWRLPVIGDVAAPAAVLIRPDGYVAWAGGDGLAAALTTWCGPCSVM